MTAEAVGQVRGQTRIDWQQFKHIAFADQQIVLQARLRERQTAEQGGAEVIGTRQNQRARGSRSTPPPSVRVRCADALDEYVHCR